MYASRRSARQRRRVCVAMRRSSPTGQVCVITTLDASISLTWLRHSRSPSPGRPTQIDVSVRPTFSGMRADCWRSSSCCAVGPGSGHCPPRTRPSGPVTTATLAAVVFEGGALEADSTGDVDARGTAADAAVGSEAGLGCVHAAHKLIATTTAASHRRRGRTPPISTVYRRACADSTSVTARDARSHRDGDARRGGAIVPGRRDARRGGAITAGDRAITPGWRDARRGRRDHAGVRSPTGTAILIGRQSPARMPPFPGDDHAAR